jgi:hypothetical protein
VRNGDHLTFHSSKLSSLYLFPNLIGLISLPSIPSSTRCHRSHCSTCLHDGSLVRVQGAMVLLLQNGPYKIMPMPLAWQDRYNRFRLGNPINCLQRNSIQIQTTQTTRVIRPIMTRAEVVRLATRMMVPTHQRGLELWLHTPLQVYVTIMPGSGVLCYSIHVS